MPVQGHPGGGVTGDGLAGPQAGGEDLETGVRVEIGHAGERLARAGQGVLAGGLGLLELVEPETGEAVPGPGGEELLVALGPDHRGDLWTRNQVIGHFYG